MAGAEVAQIYLGPAERAPVAMARKSLAAFRRVELGAGQSRRVKLRVDPRALEYWSVERHAWVAAEGRRSVYAGSSSPISGWKGKPLQPAPVSQNISSLRAGASTSYFAAPEFTSRTLLAQKHPFCARERLLYSHSLRMLQRDCVGDCIGSATSNRNPADRPWRIPGESWRYRRLTRTPHGHLRRLAWIVQKLAKRIGDADDKIYRWGFRCILIQP